MGKDTFFTKISSEEQDFEHMRPFIQHGRKLILWVVKNMRRLRRNATATELKVGKYMYHQRIIYISQAPFVFGEGESLKCYFADFYIPALRVIVEIDGGLHERPESVLYDQERDSLFAGIGIKTIRIKTSSVKAGEYKKQIPLPEEKDLRPERVTVVPEEPGEFLKERYLKSVLKERKQKVSPHRGVQS